MPSSPTVATSTALPFFIIAARSDRHGARHRHQHGLHGESLAVNHSSVDENDQKHLQATVPRPGDTAQLVRSFTSSFFVLLRDRETAQSIAATDPVTGEVMKIDVTLMLVK